MHPGILQDTIVALASGESQSAISVLRLSGPEAWTIAASVFHGKTAPVKWKANRIYFGEIRDGDHLLDEVVITLFKGPASFTGEDVVEISCHGSPYIRKELMQLLVRKGARPALAGEFTQRAFLHGKMDLSQAEAVADLIQSESEGQHTLAMQQMKGGFSQDLKALREKLVNFVALIELELDFSEEDVEFADREELIRLIQEIEEKLIALRNSFQWGNAIKTGVPVVIAGRPNAGKSTLLNQLLNEDRAIVSNIAGTTRDTIEENLVIQGISFRLTDTAGIRDETGDEIEKIGIRKTFESIERSSILLYLFDASEASLEEITDDILKYRKEGTTLLLVGNKTDRLSPEKDQDWVEKLKQLHNQGIFYDYIGISAKENTNVDAIRRQLYDYIKDNQVAHQGAIITNIRHYRALGQSIEALRKAGEGLTQHIPGDLLSQDIRKALYHIGEITGAIDVDTDILGTIFGRFCIGK